MLQKFKKLLVIPILLAIFALIFVIADKFYPAPKSSAAVLTWSNVYSSSFDNATTASLIAGGKIYIGTDSAIGGIILSSSNGTDWTQVTNRGINGAANTRISSLALFNNNIYVGTTNAGGGIIFRCELSSGCDETDEWFQVSDQGLGDPNNTEITSLISHENFLYAGTRDGAALTGTEVWRCPITTGCTAQGNFSQINLDGFGVAANSRASSMASFQGNLFVGIYNGAGSQVRYCSTCDGTDWAISNNDGFGDFFNWTVQSLVVYNNELYAGTEKGGGAPPNTAEMWKTADGTLGSWSQVNSDGFGDPNTRTFYSMQAYRDALYVGTDTGGGTGIWMTIDGSTFEQINTDGFGSASITTYTVNVLNNYFYSGIGNIAGGVAAEVYQTSLNPIIIAGSVTASQILDGTGRVNVSFTLSDPDYNNSQARVEYSLNNGSSWSQIENFSETDADTTATYGDPKVSNKETYQIGTPAGYITTSSGANTIHTVWNSKSDESTAHTNNAMIRATPNDLLYDGSTVSSAAFSLDNYAPVINSVSVVPDKAKKDKDLKITVSIDGTQSENPTVTVDGNSATTNNAQAGAQSIKYTYEVKGTEKEGANDVVATARDAAGNTRTYNTTVSLSFTDPILTATPSGGTYNSAQSVKITSNKTVGKKYYTTDGSNPKTNANVKVYTSPITIDQDTTLKFYATDLYGNTADVATETYSFDYEAPKTIATPSGGVYENPQAITLSSNEPATIYYTLDGKEPNENSESYNGKILISENTTLKFFGVDAAGNTEDVNTATYVIKSTSPYIVLTKTFGITSASSSISSTGSSMLKNVASSIYNFNIKSKFSFVLLAIIIFWSLVLISLFIISFLKNQRKVKQAIKYLFQQQKAVSATIILVILTALSLELFIGIGTKAATLFHGDVITYRIDYANQGGSGTSDLRIVDSVSSYTAYLPSSIIINGIGQSDSRNNDRTDFNITNANAVTADIGQVNPNTSGYLEFKVRVNDDVFGGTTISNNAIGSYNPGGIFTESNVVSNIVFAGGGPKPQPGPEPKPTPKPKPLPGPEPPIEIIKETPIIKDAIDIIKKVSAFLEKGNVKDIIKKYIAPLMTIASFISMLAAIPFINTILPYLAYLLQYITHPALFFGKRKRWGIIYDSLTKQPLDLAIVRLFNKDTNKLLTTRITDFLGRYLFITDPGNYFVTVTKPNYSFPSKLITEKTENTYLSETITVQSDNIQNQKGVISLDIPVDPKEGFLPNPVNPAKEIKTPIKNINDLYTLPKEVIKKADDQLIKALKRHRLNRFIIVLGPIAGLICLIISPSILTGILFVINIILLILFKQFATKRFNSWGKTLDSKNHQGLPQTVVRLFDHQYGRLLLADISKNDGRYGFLVGKDKYVLTSQKAGYELPKHQLEVSGDKEGVISQNLELKKVINGFST